MTPHWLLPSCKDDAVSDSNQWHSCPVFPSLCCFCPRLACGFGAPPELPHFMTHHWVCVHLHQCEIQMGRQQFTLQNLLPWGPLCLQHSPLLHTQVILPEELCYHGNLCAHHTCSNFLFSCFSNSQDMQSPFHLQSTFPRAMVLPQKLILVFSLSSSFSWPGWTSSTQPAYTFRLPSLSNSGRWKAAWQKEELRLGHHVSWARCRAGCIPWCLLTCHKALWNPSPAHMFLGSPGSTASLFLSFKACQLSSAHSWINQMSSLTPLGMRTVPLGMQKFWPCQS